MQKRQEIETRKVEKKDPLKDSKIEGQEGSKGPSAKRTYIKRRVSYEIFTYDGKNKERLPSNEKCFRDGRKGRGRDGRKEGAATGAQKDDRQGEVEDALPYET